MLGDQFDVVGVHDFGDYGQTQRRPAFSSSRRPSSSIPWNEYGEVRGL